MSRAMRWFWAVVVAQALFLLGWAGYHETIRQNAPIILLKGQPVDPRDLLRGDYMTLGYDISRAQPGTETLTPGDHVWVLLQPQGRHYGVAQVSRDPLSASPGQFLVRGQVGNRWMAPRTGNEIVLQYGIERYFVPEGKGTPRFKELEVEASVSPAHRLYIRRVLLDGREYP